MLSTLAPSVSKIRLTFAFCSAKPNWMPRKPKLMFQTSQKARRGLGRTAPEGGGKAGAGMRILGLGSGVPCLIKTTDQLIDLRGGRNPIQYPPLGPPPVCALPRATARKHTPHHL